MPDSFTIDVDASQVLAALEQLGERAEAHVLAASRATGVRIQQEAQRRVRRRTLTMYRAITVEDAPGPLGGVRVFVAPMDDHGMNYRWGGGLRPANFPLWHEMGTEKMTAQPFIFNSARLEAGNHERRIAEAVQNAIDEVGLGG